MPTLTLPKVEEMTSPAEDASTETTSTNTQQGSFPTKIAALVAFAAAFGAIYYFLGDQLSFTALAEEEQTLRTYADQNALLTVGVTFVLYVVLTALSIPLAAVMTLLVGWMFGFARGVFLVSFASTLGATLAFLFARFLLRDTIREKFGDRLTAFEKNLEKDGPFYLFSLRLFPGAPFSVINAGMGLTPIKTRTYWWVSQLGMLPGTMAYVYAGSTIDLQKLATDGVAGLVSTQLIIAFAVLGLLPITIKKGLEWFGPKTAVTNDADAGTESENA